MSPRRAPTVLWVAISLAAAVWVGAGWLGGEWRRNGAAASPYALHPQFQLQDSTGRVVTRNEFQGRFLLVFFGFTNCPEVCPTTLSEVGNVMDALEEKADQVQPLFISVDPERDAGADLARYTAAFHPAILGLTGSPGTLRVAAENFHVFYDQDLEATEPDSFEMAHSSSLILLNPDGAWLRTFAQDTPAAAIVADLVRRLD